MSDRRRIVSLPSGVGSPTTLLDLENGSTYQAVKDSFVVTPGARKTTMATQPRRYAGARPVAETHDNGTVEWKMLVSGATVTAAIANVETLLTQVEDLDGLFLEWRPDGATSSTYYELRGSPTWKPTYSWAQMQGAGSMYIDLSFPVAPLAWGDKITIAPTVTAGVPPAYVVLPTAIPGDAPALIDATFAFPQTTNWGLIAWMSRPGTPAAPQVSPFGVLEGEAATSVSGWAATGGGSPTARGGSTLSITTSAAGSAAATWKIDPSILPPDNFRTDAVDMEIWGRVAYAGAGTVQGLKLTPSFWDNSNSNNPKQYTREFGSTGKGVTPPGNGFQVVRLGVITLPVSTNAHWVLRLDASWTGVSGGSFSLDLDYVFLVPARQRACSPTAKPADAAYPSILSNPSGGSVTIHSDLSGAPTQPGLGGSPLEFPTGNVDVLIANSVPIPDTGVELVPSQNPSLTLTVTPRYWLAKGT